MSSPGAERFVDAACAGVQTASASSAALCKRPTINAPGLPAEARAGPWRPAAALELPASPVQRAARQPARRRSSAAHCCKALAGAGLARARRAAAPCVSGVRGCGARGRDGVPVVWPRQATDARRPPYGRACCGRRAWLRGAPLGSWAVHARQLLEIQVCSADGSGLS